jgi:hypothetical protein
LHDDSLVLAYDFDESFEESNGLRYVKDLSKHGHHARIHGSPKFLDSE